ncbi:MAG: DUF4364 family protein [Clostridia bacterium]|nr:DUF4364 family protein [Clostridia bacterium]
MDNMESFDSFENIKFDNYENSGSLIDSDDTVFPENKKDEEIGAYDAFFQGVEPGGLRTRGEIRLLICYIVCRVDGGITKTQLIDVICKKSLANYFEISQALSDMIKTGNIRCEFVDGEEFLYPTELGKSNTAQLEDELPYTVKEAALNTAVEMLTKFKRERENDIKIEPHGTGYDVTLSVLDNDDRLLSVTVFVADLEQAQAVKEKYLRDPIKFYSTVVALLMA